jgi:uncharacterized protein (UPF0210 family)
VLKIRAVTLGMDLPAPQVRSEPFAAAAEFLGKARADFGAAGLEVQTTRLAGPELSADERDFATWAAETERTAAAAGVEYLSLGRLSADACGVQMTAEQVAPVLAAGSIAFLSADLIDPRTGLPSVAMAAACARAVRGLAASTDQGFGNLRFCATAHCPPNIPFLPAAYHGGGAPKFAVAVQAADVVLQALGGGDGMLASEDRLVEALEAAAGPIERVADELSAASGFAFVGIDLSPAPFPADEVSIGGALEAGGVERFGAPGTLYLAGLVTRAIRRTRLRRCGFSGLMLPVLEDSVLARRMAERPLSVHELLVYSAVCGTGLDTVPLPGDISEAELAGVYLDVAALSVALGGKPLTARLLPVPGASAGDATTYTFDYFANSRVPPAIGRGAAGVLTRGG